MTISTGAGCSGVKAVEVDGDAVPCPWHRESSEAIEGARVDEDLHVNALFQQWANPVRRRDAGGRRVD